MSLTRADCAGLGTGGQRAEKYGRKAVCVCVRAVEDEAGEAADGNRTSDWGKPQETCVRIVAVVAEIRTRCLPNASHTLDIKSPMSV